MDTPRPILAGVDRHSCESIAVLIVGGGQAGCECAFALRQQGMAGRIVLACEERCLPYERPPLSKGVLNGKSAEERLELKSVAAFERAGIEVLSGDAVIALDAEAHIARTRSGKHYRYLHCVFASGAYARPLAEADAAGALNLRTIDDARRLRTRLRSGERLVIIGAGFIGLEVATLAAESGMQVDVLEAAPAILSGRLSAYSAVALTERHAQRGVVIHTNAHLLAIRSAGGACTVELADGRVLSADTLVSAVGSIPATEVAEQAGAICANGIVVDAHCQTSLPDCHAIGDCASSAPFGELAPTSRCRIESVFNALHQARIVAAYLTGKPLPPQKAPAFWSDQAGGRLQMAGLLVPAFPVQEKPSLTDRGWQVERFQAGQLRVVEAFDSPVDFIRATRCIGQPAPNTIPDTAMESA